MADDIIGKGTWLDKIAHEVLERERKLRRENETIRTESGLGASGIPHLGSLGDCTRAFGIKLALESQGQDAEYIAFSDDMDGLRKIPTGFPESLTEHLGHPVSSIPDPFGCHPSYGDHVNYMLRDALDKCGIEYRFYSATEAYQRGLFNDQIEKILANASRVGDIIKQELGQEKYTEVLPYFPVCSSCGKIYTTRAYEFLPSAKKILYTCEGVALRDRKIPGCGNKGAADYTKGEGKLSWKVEFAARWDALRIGFEAYGKDIADSVKVNDRVCEEILGYVPPYHVRYEMFLDEGGKKISKSVGNVFTPQLWLKYGSAQSLLLLMYKRIVGARVVKPQDVPSYVDELDTLEDAYFGKKKTDDKKELAKLRGLYEYTWLLRPPSDPDIHVPYALLVNLASVASKDAEMEYTLARLKKYGYLKDVPTSGLIRKIEGAINYSRDFAAIETEPILLSNEERSAVEELIERIPKETDENTLQNVIFGTAKKHGLTAARFFRILYMMLIGAPSGPRLGTYILDLGREQVVGVLKKELGGPP
ncbi:MAG: lysine--tRNA ligase [Candidatus Bathyarchaeota archaeon]|nr:lysine--tRNA ligase [Candidatus Bathyarchaeota archaeon]